MKYIVKSFVVFYSVNTLAWMEFYEITLIVCIIGSEAELWMQEAVHDGFCWSPNKVSILSNMSLIIRISGN